MARQKKCIICNELIVDEQGVPYKGRYAHQKCFNIAIKTLQKDKSEQIDKVAEKKKVGRKRLCQKKNMKRSNNITSI